MGVQGAILYQFPQFDQIIQKYSENQDRDFTLPSRGLYLWCLEIIHHLQEICTMLRLSWQIISTAWPKSLTNLSSTPDWQDLRDFVQAYL